MLVETGLASGAESYRDIRLQDGLSTIKEL
jgi:hypothetical protein